MRFLCFILLATTLLGCSNSKTNRSKLIHFIPESCSVIIKTNNLESLKSSIYNNDFLSHFLKSNSFKSLESKLTCTSLLKPTGNVLIGINKSEQDSLEFSLVTKHHAQLFQKDSVSNYIEETLKYDNRTIVKSTLNNVVFYSTIIDSIFIASSSKSIIDGAFEKVNLNELLEKTYSTTDNNKTLSVIIKPNSDLIKSFFIDNTIPLHSFTNYIALDTDINQNKIVLSGITKATDSSKSLINVFKNTTPQENQIQHVTPSNSDGFMSITFDNYEVFQNNLAKFNHNDSIFESTSLFDNIVEVGVIYESKNRAVVLHSIDAIATKDALLAQQNEIDTYRQVTIYNFSNSGLFAQNFKPFISSTNFTNYCLLDNFFVFSTDMEMTQNIIANYQNKTTLSGRNYFKDIKSELSDASSMMLIMNPSTLENVIKNNFTENLNINLTNYKVSGLQFVYDTNFAHVNGIINKSKTRALEHSISEEFSIKLENELLTNPQFVKNHITKQKEIVVQDINNNLYLISNQGKILWKKRLHGAVLGKINQIDIYKNGRLQLVFATPNRIYVLDRNGNDVAPFPAKFNDEITQPLSVFDYDKKKNYRLLVTQGKNVLMYNTKAKIVSGFKFKSANGIINHQPQHFRIGSKDYITIKTDTKLYILDRTGKNRVTPKTNSSYSTEAIYLYTNKFTTTSKDGKLVTIDARGNAAIQNLNLSSNHHITSSSKTLVTQSENKLSIRNKSVEIDYGNYIAPQLFYINDKIYVTTTDLQTQKVFLYDSQTKLLPNFPVYGNSAIDIDNIDTDRNLEFVTKGESNSVILYQIN
ncbi:ribonuclease HII [uncultured Algibacter sp.]|uniref:ribonuclease HII n=1 Tax=uncultured Algibacter sp. TaxID=298659 RepID=UPI002608E407|nr:ribonuclease HII [uncultured Algibacter sp.]